MNKQSDFSSQGIILVSVLLILVLIIAIMHSLLLSVQLQLKINTAWITAAQQFEYVESGLKYGENYLTQNTETVLAYDTPIILYKQYENDTVQVTLQPLSEILCQKSGKKQGHYYQINSKIYPKKQAKFIQSGVHLQATIAVMDQKIHVNTATLKSNTRTSWCQLR